MLLMIDNYDSFTFNLVQYFGELGQKVKVLRNDEVNLDQIEDLNPEFIVISPGPCTPNEAGISIEAIKEFSGKIPILGVCLGHQAIGAAFGAKIIKANQIMHGKISDVIHDGSEIFKNIESPFQATRYHSLVIEEQSFPDCLEITAESNDDGIREIMALRHKDLKIFGLQFHPESILTTDGKTILANFINL
ncbi:MAG: aminodeoxychorismate/anthranilate synthase component II [Gammaproteobacteria bacterium]